MRFDYMVEDAPKSKAESREARFQGQFNKVYEGSSPSPETKLEGKLVRSLATPGKRWVLSGMGFEYSAFR